MPLPASGAPAAPAAVERTRQETRSFGAFQARRHSGRGPNCLDGSSVGDLPVNWSDVRSVLSLIVNSPIEWPCHKDQ